VRYRYDGAGQRHLKTVDLIVEAAPWHPDRAARKGAEIVGVRVTFQEVSLPQACEVIKMASDLKVRIAVEGDLDSLVRLAVAFRDHLRQSMPSDADFRDSIATLLQDTASEFFLGHNAQGTALGYVLSRYRYSAWISALEAEIEDVFVAPEARRCGVGQRLVECAIARAAERGCRAIGLNTNERNEGALALYRKLCFGAERALWNGGRQLWLQRALETV
jgi:ribosomal protein S18 acetylase RimI-like enzyme